MKIQKHYLIPPLMGFLLLGFAGIAGAVIDVQCPGDLNGDAIPDPFMFNNQGNPTGKANPDYDPNVQCMHLTGGDGFATMADGSPQYIFSFGDATGTPPEEVMATGVLSAALPAPSIVVDQGKEFYLSLSNVGMMIRPDLFDPHTVHFHGFPQSSTVFDGLPESGISINMGSTLTYYYNLVEPGTYMYHCHVEATEHMQMGMLGNLYVRALQSFDGDPGNGIPAGTLGGNSDPGAPLGYAYNDGDGTTAYDVEVPLQLGGIDPDFHNGSWTVQPLPFAEMWDRYPLINGRGYPDTLTAGPIAQPMLDGEDLNGSVDSQVEDSLIVANQGDRILLRLSNLNITVTHTLMSPSIPMEVVGIDAKQLRSTSGENLYYTTNSVSMAGGMSADVILDTAAIPVGEYYLYAANLQYLANYNENEPTGGMMTKIVVQ